MVHRRFAGIIDEAVGEASQTAHATDRYDLAAGLAGAFSALVAFDKELEESHRCGEDGGDVGLEGLGPELLGAVIELVVAELSG